MFHVGLLCYAVLSVPCSLVITCWEKVDLLAFLCVVFFVFWHFPYGVLRQVRYLIVSIPDLCLPLYFEGQRNVKEDQVISLCSMINQL